MIRTRWGRIVNISSVAGVIGNRGPGSICAAKAGAARCHQIARARTCHARHHRQCIAPALSPPRRLTRCFRRKRRNLVPMKRVGEPKKSRRWWRFGLRPSCLHSGQVISIKGEWRKAVERVNVVKQEDVNAVKVLGFTIQGFTEFTIFTVVTVVTAFMRGSLRQRRRQPRRHRRELAAGAHSLPPNRAVVRLWGR